MKTFDCIVIGASCVGGMTAKALAKHGVKTALLEEHSQPGKFNKCTALVSATGLKSIGVRFQDTVLNEVHGAVLHSPRFSFTVTRKTPVAYVLDRQAFDEKCVEEAVDLGVELHLNSGVRSLKREGSLWVADTASGLFYSKTIVGCDGLNSFTARALGFPHFKRFVSAWEAEYSFKQEPKDKVHVYLDQKLAKNFFAWSVPVDGNNARVGLATTEPSTLNKGKKVFLDKLGLSDDLKTGREFNYSIPLYPRSQTQKDTALLAGDAAGQVKSTTGGGIVFGGLCGLKAAESVRQFLDGGSLDYEGRWRKAFEKTFSMHWFLHDRVFSLANPGLDLAFAMAKITGIPFILEKAGDMDFIVSRG